MNKIQITYLNSVMPSCIAAPAIQSFSQADHREGYKGLIPPILVWLFSSISFTINVHLQLTYFTTMSQNKGFCLISAVLILAFAEGSCAEVLPKNPNKFLNGTALLREIELYHLSKAILPSLLFRSH